MHTQIHTERSMCSHTNTQYIQPDTQAHTGKYMYTQTHIYIKCTHMDTINIYTSNIYIPTHTEENMCSHTYIQPNTQAHTDKYMYTQTRIYIKCTHMDTINIYTSNIYIPTHTQEDMCPHTYIQPNTQAHTDKYMYMQTHIYTSNTHRHNKYIHMKYIYPHMHRKTCAHTPTHNTHKHTQTYTIYMQIHPCLKSHTYTHSEIHTHTTIYTQTKHTQAHNHTFTKYAHRLAHVHMHTHVCVH